MHILHLSEILFYPRDTSLYSEVPHRGNTRLPLAKYLKSCKERLFASTEDADLRGSSLRLIRIRVRHVV